MAYIAAGSEWNDHDCAKLFMKHVWRLLEQHKEVTVLCAPDCWPSVEPSLRVHLVENDWKEHKYEIGVRIFVWPPRNYHLHLRTAVLPVSSWAGIHVTIGWDWNKARPTGFPDTDDYPALCFLARRLADGGAWELAQLSLLKRRTRGYEPVQAAVEAQNEAEQASALLIGPRIHAPPPAGRDATFFWSKIERLLDTSIDIRHVAIYDPSRDGSLAAALIHAATTAGCEATTTHVGLTGDRTVEIATKRDPPYVKVVVHTRTHPWKTWLNGLEYGILLGDTTAMEFFGGGPENISAIESEPALCERWKRMHKELGLIDLLVRPTDSSCH